MFFSPSLSQADQLDWQTSLQATMAAVAQGDFNEALGQADRLFASSTDFAPSDPRRAMNHWIRGRAFRLAGRYVDSENDLKKALDIAKLQLSTDDPFLGSIYNSLSLLYEATGQYTDAIASGRRALPIFEKYYGRNSQMTASVLMNLGIAHSAIGDYDAAELVLSEAVGITTRLTDEPTIISGTALNLLGRAILSLGRPAEAERILARALTMLETAGGDTSPALSGMSAVYLRQWRLPEAIAYSRRAVAVAEDRWGPDHPTMTFSVGGLAAVLADAGRFEEAAALSERALELLKATHGTTHADIARISYNMGLLQNHLGNLEQAASYLQDAVNIGERTLGSENAWVGMALGALAKILSTQERHNEAEALATRALAIARTSSGERHPIVAVTQRSLARIYQDQKRFDEARSLLESALDIDDETLGPAHITSAWNHEHLAELEFGRGDVELALFHARISTAIQAAHLNRQRRHTGEQAVRPYEDARWALNRHIDLLAANLNSYDNDTRLSRISEAIEVAQLARQSIQTDALTLTASRLAASDDQLANIVRARQNAIENMHQVELASLDYSTTPDIERGALREKLTALVDEVAALDVQINREFPMYKALVAPGPISVGQIQQALDSGEVMLFYLLEANRGMVWAIRNDYVYMHPLTIGDAGLAPKIEALHAAASVRATADNSGLLPAFPLDKAHELYKLLVEPVEAIISDADRLLIVPDGTLSHLPFSMLVAQEMDIAASTEAYRKAKWLGTSYAIANLPSASSLYAQRNILRPSRAQKAFAGLGTGNGLNDLHSSVDTDGDNILVKPDAAESLLGELALASYRVIAFASPLVAIDNDVTGEHELAIALARVGTSDSSDGKLTARELAKLKFDAQCVLLSMPTVPDISDNAATDALDDLVRAILFAGSRSVLLPYWATDSSASAAIWLSMTKAMIENPELDRSEALRQAFHRLIHDRSNSHFAHPAYWAPFRLVGVSN